MLQTGKLAFKHQTIPKIYPKVTWKDSAHDYTLINQMSNYLTARSGTMVPKMALENRPRIEYNKLCMGWQQGFAATMNYGGFMADIFRKSSLDKLSSPEQLDKAITIISPSFWIAALGSLLIIVVALLWSIFGRLPVKVSGTGVYQGDNGMYTVLAGADGFVENVYFMEGDEIKAGDTIAKLDDDDLQTELDELTSRRNDVDAVTFYSYDDPATADTKPLLDLKAQVDLAGTSLTANQIALRERYASLSKQRTKTSNAKDNVASKKSSLKKKQSSYIKATEKYKKAQEAATEAQKEYEKALQKLADAGVDPDIDPEDTEAMEVLTPEQIELVTERDKCKKSLDKALADVDSAEKSVKQLEMDNKNAETEYSRAVQTYESEKAAQKSLQDACSQLEAKVKAEGSNKNSQMSSLEEQFTAAKGSIIDQLDQEITRQSDTISKMTIKSKVSGTVSGVNITEGGIVTAGANVCKISTDEVYHIDIICYVPVSEGRKIKEGMKVMVYPSTVNRQEYGHMLGTVDYVSDSAVSSEDMLNELGDSSLVQAFQQSGPLIRVECLLDKDRSTASGYKWSSNKGSEVTIDAGTFISADIVTESNAPITMLVPYIKDKLFGDNTQNNQIQGN